MNAADAKRQTEKNIIEKQKESSIVVQRVEEAIAAAIRSRSFGTECKMPFEGYSGRLLLDACKYFKALGYSGVGFEHFTGIDGKPCVKFMVSWEHPEDCIESTEEGITEMEGAPMVFDGVEEITRTERVGDVSTTTTWKFREPVEHYSTDILASFISQPNSRSNQF